MLSSQEITEIVLRERPVLTAYLNTVTRNYHLAEDVYQEICVKAIGCSEAFSSKSRLLNWFRVSSRNRAIDIIRTREVRYIGLSVETLQSLEHDWEEPTVEYNKMMLDALEQCLEMLTPRSREIVKLRTQSNR